MDEISDKERELFIRYGSAASEALFDFPCHFFKTPDCIGMVAYRVECKCAIVFGGPICQPDETSKLMDGAANNVPTPHLAITIAQIANPASRTHYGLGVW